MLVVWPSGWLIATLGRTPPSAVVAGRLAFEVGLGTVVVAIGAMAGSVFGVAGIRTVVFGLAGTGLVYAISIRTWPRRSASADATRWLTAVAASALAVHAVLLPPYFSGVDANGTLVIAGIGGDGFYLPIAQQIARTGYLAENPFYAGQPMLYHHFLSNFLVAAFWLTTPGPPDPFGARLLFHFALAMPLMVAMVAALACRWTRSIGWTAVLTALFVLPVTAYPTHGVGWEGIQSMNAFWVIGVHGDLGYAFGLVVMLLLVFTIDRVAAAPAAIALPAMGAAPSCPPESVTHALSLAQILLAAGTQFKFNFVLGYGFPAEIAILALAARAGSRVFVRVGLAGVLALAVVQAVPVAVSGDAAGRTVEWQYGALATDKLLGALTGNAADGLRPLVALVDGIGGTLQPPVIVAAYCLAYTPLFAAVLLHALAAVRRRAIVDGFLVGTAISSLIVALGIVEGGPAANSWNVAAHLHYLIPCLAVAAAARLVGSVQTSWSFKAGAALTVLVLAVGVLRMATDGPRFTFWRTWTFPDPALTTFLRAADGSAPPDAVLVRAPLPSDLADEYIAMLTNRSLFLSNSYAYTGLHADAAARHVAADAVLATWPAPAHVQRGDLSGLPATRPLVAIGMLPAGSRPPGGANCIERYCACTVE